jgi:transposase, IS5 family
MGQPRFKELGIGSFFGSPVYLRVVPRDHFLVKLQGLLDWEALVPLLLPAYEGLAREGRPPYSPVVMLKVLIVALLYGLSERQTEEVVNFHLAVKEFVGLAVDEAAPDHSTLTLFKRRLREAGCWERFEAVNDEVLRQARAGGITLGSIQVVDSVHTVADVDNEADRRRQQAGQLPRDGEAQVVRKGKRRVTQADGSVVTEEVQYRGYKSHVSLNAETGLITTIRPSVGSAADNEQFAALLAHDEQLGVGARIYTGDRAYDDSDLHCRLWGLQKCSALKLKENRIGKKDGNRQIWEQLLASPEYQAGLAERYKVERKFGEAKRWHGFGRCRYVGLVRHGIQAHLTALALNLKRIVTLLTGVRFRAPKGKAQPAVA